MNNTPPTPAAVEVGQIWRDNDQRTKGSGYTYLGMSR